MGLRYQADPEVGMLVLLGEVGGMEETASPKNAALKAAGAEVPSSFDELGEMIGKVYSKLVKTGAIVPKPEVPPPPVPIDYNWARELGLIRKPASFMSTISDERGQELLYAGIPISEVFAQEMGIGGVLGLLWFQRRLPPYACKFLEMCLMNRDLTWESGNRKF